MTNLDKRLQTVADQIRCRVHTDIGSDHGYLLKSLLLAGRIEFGIAIENKPAPFENSRRSLAGLAAEVRLADGLAGLQPNEANGLSMCGMGGELIVRILSDFPDRIPDTVVLQPNNRAEAVRQWVRENGFHLIDERLVHHRKTYFVLVCQRSHAASDPVYDDLNATDALLFGPHLIRRRDPALLSLLQREHIRLRQYGKRNPVSQQRFESVCRLLETLKTRQERQSHRRQ